ncbi:MAG: hypothetical protein AAB493_02245 [Patescibacteria group bacterium]
MTFLDKIKYRIWKMIYWVFVPTQRNLLKLNIIRHDNKRQRYHLGWLTSSKTLNELKAHLSKNWGFGNHFISWVDEGQVLSWRKLPDFHHQYHLRVFEDGEIKGHFEFTPEARPISHLKAKLEEERKEEFFKFLGDFITEEKTVSHFRMDPDAFDPYSQIAYKVKK